MSLTAIAFWREMTIVASLTLLLVMAEETVLGSQAKMHMNNTQNALIQTSDDPTSNRFLKHDNHGENVENDHSNNGHINMEQDRFAPIFKYPTEMYRMYNESIDRSVMLNCVAAGNPTPNITWYKNKSTLFNGEWYMPIRKLENDDRGNYTCVVCNELGCINHTTALHIQGIEDRYSPYFTLPTQMYEMEKKQPGSTVMLNCVAAGMPTPNITWYKNKSTPIMGKLIFSNYYLNFEKLTMNDNGNYTCVVCNELGCINHTTALHVQGIPVPNITWYKNKSTPITGELIFLNYYLKFKKLTMNDNGNYTCVICNELGCINHTTALHVQDMEQHRYPSYFKLTTYMDRMVEEPAGSTVRIRCPAEGMPTPNITWYKNKSTPITGELIFLEDYLNFEKLTMNDNGNYTCVVCNELGCVNHTTALHVQGSPAPNITWYKNMSKKMYFKSIMILEELTEADNGNYTCIVCNELGCINDTTALLVQERYLSKPGDSPGNVTAVVNATAILYCPPVSDFEPSIYWFRLYNYSSVDDIEGYRNVPLPTGKMRIMSEDLSDKPERLTIFNVTKKDEGWYMCISATHSNGITTAKGFLSILESNPIPETPDNGKYTLYNIFTIVFGAIFFIAVIIVVMICKKLKRERKQKQRDVEMIETYWIKKVTVEKPQIDSSPNATDQALLKPVVKIEQQKVSREQNKTSGAKMMSEYELQLDIDWEVPREILALGKVLGEGEFGKVVRAECVGVLKSRMQSVVAVKMLKEGHTDAEMIALVSEMEIMKLIGKHVNIINLLGCCTQDGPLYVITEYTPNGNLREFLRNHRPGNKHQAPAEDLKEKKTLTENDLIWFSYQVARGMEYLASRRCIHCDLAARNVLVSRDCILKIADFGLAKDIDSNGYYRKKTEGKLPARWMAPESLYNFIFTTETDVWSFGVLLWEIMTYGAMPYPKVSGQYLYEYLRAGRRMDKPPCCSGKLYILMRECWAFSPGDRPSFTKLMEDLDKIFTVTANQ